MKKIGIIISILIICICCTVSGCSSTSDIDTPNTTSTYVANTEEDKICDLHEGNIVSMLSHKIPISHVYVSVYSGCFDLSAYIGPDGRINDFGIYILEVQEAFENEFAKEERGKFSVDLLMDGTDPPLFYFISNDYDETEILLSGKILDDRSGDLVSHKISGVESLCELFPATSIYIAKKEIDANDLRIYEEVMEILNNQFDRPEDEIIEELAPNYGMTASELKQFLFDTMEKIFGHSENPAETVPETTSATENQSVPYDPTIQTYPLNVDSAYLDYAASIPDIIYTTTASENGLAGSIYFFDGSVEDTMLMGDEDNTFSVVFVKTDSGKVMVTNIYKTIYDNTVKTVGESDAKIVLTDNIDDYIFPEIGDTARFIAIYDGYSETYDMPFFYLGASSCLLELLGYDDPVSAETETTESVDVSQDSSHLDSTSAYVETEQSYSPTVSYETEDHSDTNVGGTVYWVSGGEVYHSTSSCRTLSRSKNILSGTISEANSAGKSRQCKVCY